MDIAFEQKIRQRAYEIWMAAGMVDGAADEHWLLAKNDIREEPASAKSVPVKTTKTKGASKLPKAAAKTKGADKVEMTAKPASKPTVKVVRKAAVVEAHAGA